MKKIIITLVLLLATISANAQYNNNFKEDFNRYGESQYLIEQYNKGHEQIATGGIVLSTTMAFDAIYFGILAGSANKPHANFEHLHFASIVGGAVTCVGVIASLWQFASGYANIKNSKKMVYFNKDGALCISIPEKRKR